MELQSKHWRNVCNEILYSFWISRAWAERTNVQRLRRQIWWSYRRAVRKTFNQRPTRGLSSICCCMKFRMDRNTSSASCCILTAKHHPHCSDVWDTLMNTKHSYCLFPHVEHGFCPDSGGSPDEERAEGGRSSWRRELSSAAGGRYDCLTSHHQCSTLYNS